MKLNITLSLALATACSAFALSPGRSTLASRGNAAGYHHEPAAAAFVNTPELVGKRGEVSATALRAEAAVADAPRGGEADNGGGGSKLANVDVGLMIYFALWYVGNYYYNITNKLALKATGGASGFPLTISALQLGIGSLYGIFLWLAPDARERPTVTMDDVSILLNLFI